MNAGYSTDSFLLGLQILEKLEVDGEGELCIRVVAAIFLMTTKLN